MVVCAKIIIFLSGRDVGANRRNFNFGRRCLLGGKHFLGARVHLNMNTILKLTIITASLKRNQINSRLFSIVQMLSVEYPILKAPIRPVSAHVNLSQSGRKSTADLNKMKELVPAKIELLGSKRWSQITTVPLPRTSLKPVSRAYFKLREIVETCALGPYDRTLSLCEAPGGFVQCIAEAFPRLQSWSALSIDNNIDFKNEGLDFTRGQILDLGSDNDVRNADVRERLSGMNVDLVTADGSLGEDHSTLEESHFPLLLAETDAAMKALKLGGDFVCKYFEANATNTQIWISVLTNIFRYVSIVKPNSSKPTNSERYVVCRGFKKYYDIIWENYTTNKDWLEDLRDIIDEHNKLQYEALQRIFRAHI